MSQVIKTSEFRNMVQNNDGVVVVDFFATWCGPCKMLSPVFESLGSDMRNRADFFKVDIDRSIELAERYEVSTVPTLIVFKNGKEVDRLVGFVPKENLRRRIESHV